jgi:hypothetical protein
MNRREFLKARSAAVLAASLPASAAADLPSASDSGHEVMIYSATPGGMAAAVAAARLGCRVSVAAPENHIGGIVPNGLTSADILRKQAVGGLLYEFTRRVLKHNRALDRARLETRNVELCRDGYFMRISSSTIRRSPRSNGLAPGQSISDTRQYRRKSSRLVTAGKACTASSSMKARCRRFRRTIRNHTCRSVMPFNGCGRKVMNARKTRTHARRATAYIRRVCDADPSRLNETPASTNADSGEGRFWAHGGAKGR